METTTQPDTAQAPVPLRVAAGSFLPGVQDDGSWILPLHRLEKLRHRVEVLNRRVKKTGGGGLWLDTAGTFTVEVADPDDEEGKRKLIETWAIVVVCGAVPVVEGWSFVARIEHHADLGNIVAKAPSCRQLELPLEFRTAEATCDHCKAKRNRKDTFVLRDEAGILRRVGRDCLQDFLRGDPEQALRLWSLLSSVESLLQGASDEGYGGGGGVPAMDTVFFLACTCSAIRHAGWVSKALAYGTGKQPTASLAAWIGGKAPKGRALDEWRAMQPTEADFEEAGEVVAWVEGLEALNDYLHNLRVAVLIRHVERRHEGIVASGVMSRRRDLERAAQELAEAAQRAAGTAPAGPSEYLGEYGKRLDLHRVRLLSADPKNTEFGPTYLHLAVDELGNEVKWFDKKALFKAGDWLRGHGTVKGHSEFKGRKQTLIGRPKFEVVPAGTVDVAAPAAPETPRVEPQREEDVPF